MILKGGAIWTPTPADVIRWERAYPGIDIAGEMLRAESWLDGNPTRRPTERGVKRFMVNWLGKCKPSKTGGGRSTREMSLEENLTDTSWAR